MTTADGPGAGYRSDTEALRSLSTTYAFAVDDRDGERFASLFVDSGELLVPNLPDDVQPVISRLGRESLRRVPDGLRRYERTFHQVSNDRFSIDGDRATGEVQCVAHHVMGAPNAAGGAADNAAGDGAGDGAGGAGNRTGIDTVWFIRYLDDYVRTDRGWRFERRALHLQWVEEHPVSLLPTAANSEPH
ncbi:MAG: nuclear transport factor 2 family protein [Acidimicrobiales bacterium]